MELALKKIRKTIIMLLILAGASWSWYPPDKYQPAAHFSLSAIFCITTFYVWEKVSYSVGTRERVKKLWWSVPISVMPGVAKEFVDMRKNKTFNRTDMYYNILGSWTGGTIVLFLEF